MACDNLGRQSTYLHNFCKGTVPGMVPIVACLIPVRYRTYGMVLNSPGLLSLCQPAFFVENFDHKTVCESKFACA